MGVVLDFAALWSLIRRPRIWWFVSTPARNRSPCIDGVGRVPDTERNRGQFDDLRECLVGHGLVSVPLLLEPSTCHPLALPGDPPPAPGPGLVGPDLAAIAPSSDRDILRSRSTLLPLPLNGTTSVRRIFYNRIALRKFPIIVRCKAIPHHPNAHVTVASIAILGVLSFANRQSPIRFFSNPQLTLVRKQSFLSAQLVIIGYML
jgi:hypothetical protein